MARIFALLHDPTACARLHDAVRRERAAGAVHDVRLATDAAALGAWCAHEEVHAAVFDPFAPGAPPPEFCSALHARFPALALLVYADLTRHAARYHDWLLRAGVREVVLLNEEDSPRGLRERLARGLLLPLYSTLLPKVQERFPAHLHGFGERPLRAAHRPPVVEDVVALDYRSERTLRRELERAGLPPLAQRLIWFRLLHAAHLLDDAGRTVGNVARTLGFASENALRNQLQRYVRRSPGTLRGCGARECAWVEFMARCGASNGKSVADTV